MFHRRRLLCVLGALPLAGCATLPGVRGGNTVGLATFNIYHDRDRWDQRLPLILDVLRDASPDVIGLQEVLQDAATNLPNQAETIARTLGYEVVFVSADAEGAPRRYGNAILTRLPIVEQATTRLEPMDDYRTAVRVRVRAGDRLVDVVNTHLHHTPEGGAIRQRQIETLMTWLGNTGQPLILMGDLNASLTNPEMARLQPPRFVSVLPTVHPDQATRTTLNPAYGHRLDQIDHILVEQRHFEPVTAAIVGDEAREGVWPSDHFAVVGTVRMRSEG
jgi:endonuclease/exonuclease/phosphatase family metal-dependent hydrolase